MYTRAERRHNSVKKALRKKHLSDSWTLDNRSWYDNLHQYSKNKIHCSCPMCQSKTNSKSNKSKGSIDPNRYFCRLATTNKRYGKKQWKMNDLKKIQGMKDRLDYGESVS